MGILDKILANIAKRKVKKMLQHPEELKQTIDSALYKTLVKLNDSERVDEIETKLVIAGIQAAQAYFGVNILNDEARKIVAERVVKCLGKINEKLQDHLEN